MDRENMLSDIKKRNVKFVDLQFVDIMGQLKTCAITAERLPKVLEDGLWFDGSSIEGFVRIFESDMFLMPDIETYAILPWTDGKIARIMCDVYLSEGKPFEGDPRFILKRVLKKASKMGFKYKVGPELEFFIFKNSNGNLKPEPHDIAGYFDFSTRDLAADLRREVVSDLEAMEIKIEMSHHEVAPGQHEIDFEFDEALTIADRVMTYKAAVKTVAMKYSLYASFMPKPLFGINGSGMHVHQSLWKENKNEFYDPKEIGNLSDIAKQFIAGQLAHVRSMSAVLAPTVNSYKRLVPGYEAPVYICWGRINRSALIRVPNTREGKEASTRVELRCPDPSSNPYLAFAVMLASGLDGIKNKMMPPEPVEEDVYHFDDKRLAELYIATMPGSLDEASSEIAKDKIVQEALGKHIYEKLIEAQKRQWEEYRIQVTEWELKKYFSIL
ncbi:MAG: type I glutamate--ammonia ligase [Candidatus Methylarchaceae archaeon HK01M]|nr:type I glutamate--ammonia ligase [Candidatus Methylarchaceae archaeon HK01M]